MQPKHILIIAIVLIVLGAGVAMYGASGWSTNNSNDPAGPTGAGSISSGVSDATLDWNKSLHLGSNGPEVKKLQELYNASSFATTALIVDGQFGSKTLGAVVKVLGVGGGFSTTLTQFNNILNGGKPSAETKSLLERLGFKL